MVATSERVIIRGVIHCDGCRVLLARVVREHGGSVLVENQGAGTSTVRVVVAGQRMLRCGACGGRTLVRLPSMPPANAPLSSIASQ
jgi:hypothetical protein